MAAKIVKACREGFSGKSTGNAGSGYYGSKGEAVHAYESVLADYDYHFSRTELTDFNGDEGRATLTICNDDEGSVGCAILSWYRMPSGRYEFTGYIA